MTQCKPAIAQHNQALIIWRVALNVPLNRNFDYLAPINTDIPIQVGIRVKVPFGKQQLIGVVIEQATNEIAANKLKSIIAALDKTPVVSTHMQHILSWASHYYKYPLGQVMHKALATKLRRGETAQLPLTKYLQLTPLGIETISSSLKRSPKQEQLLNQLQNTPTHTLQWNTIESTSARSSLIDKELGQIISQEKIISTPAIPSDSENKLILSFEQQQAVDSLRASLGNFSCTLLEGVTGSGKTEVYLRTIEKVLAMGAQVLVLVPEIALAPQMYQRCQKRFGNIVYNYHSQLSENIALCAWVSAWRSHPMILVGTRSAIFLPLENLGLIIVDEEHDQSFKEHTAFHYCAKNLAIKRAHMLSIPILLGSATPSLESIHNVNQGHYRHLRLSQRATDVSLPKVSLIDMQKYRADDGFTQPVLTAIGEHLSRGNQVLVFLNRRGYAPLLSCSSCDWIAQCPNCDINLVIHFKQRKLRCHHCHYTCSLYTQCPQCNTGTLTPQGRGTERVEYKLRSLFTNYPVLRIDSDTTSNRHAFIEMTNKIEQGQPAILIGTQMLAKGHHFPKVNLVVIVHADAGLFSPDFRSSERLYQLIVQASGRAGRLTQGEVMIQSYHSKNHMLELLLSKGYNAWAQYELTQREQAHFPPFIYLAVINCAAPDISKVMDFLQQLQRFGKEFMQQHAIANVEFKGPVTAYVTKKAHYHHAWLLCQSNQRKSLHQVTDNLLAWIEQYPHKNKLRISIDIDPQNIM